MATSNFGRVATTSTQRATNQANLQRSLAALGAQSTIRNGNVVVTQNSPGGGSSVSPSRDRGSSSGGGSSYVAPRPITYGSGSNPAGSQSPVATPKPPALGTVGNPAGSQSPIGSPLQSRAVNSSAFVGPVQPKKPDWRTDLASIQAGNVRSQQAGGQVAPSVSGYGMTRNPDGPNYRLQSNGGNVPNYSYNGTQQRTYAPAMTVAPKPTSNFFGNIMNSLRNFSSSSGGNSNSASALGAFNSAFGGSPEESTSIPQDNTPESNLTAPSRAVDNTPRPQNQTIVQGAIKKADDLTNQVEANKQALDAVPIGDEYREEREQRTQQFNESKALADAARDEVSRLESLSQEELDKQKIIDDEEQALKLGLTDVAGQPIPLGFITGQSSALERRSLNRTSGIRSDLARLQSARQAALSAAKFKSGIAEDRYGTAQSNLTSITAEQRKRQRDVEDRNRSEEMTLADRAQSQENIERTFQENVRQSGLEYANEQKRIAIAQMNANTAAQKTEDKGVTDVQLKQEINKVLATSSFQSASKQDKRNYILSQGGDPADFGY